MYILLLLGFVQSLKSQNVYIFGENVNLRENADEKSKSFKKISGKVNATLLGNFENNNSDYRIWSKIRLEDNLEGYVYSDFIYDSSINTPQINTIYPEIEFKYSDNNIILINKVNKAEIETLSTTKKIKYLNRTDQINQYLLITYSITDYEYLGFIYDLSKKKIVFELPENTIDLMTCGLQSISPHNLFLILDTGTSQNRQKYIIEISTWKFFTLNNIHSNLEWVAPKTFVYFETPKKNETKLPIRKVDKNNDKLQYVLQEKRIWNNGRIFRTTKTRYVFEE